MTQPLAELVSGQSEDDALHFLKAIDDLSAKEGFIPSVGPAKIYRADAVAGGSEVASMKGCAATSERR